MEFGELQAVWSNEAEQGVLGSCLIDPRCVPDVFSALIGDDFFSPRHREIYRAIGELDSRQIPIDVITLWEEIKRLGSLNDPTIPAYLAELIAAVPSAAHVKQYARTVRACRHRRRVSEIGHALIEAAKYTESIDAVLDAAERQLYEAQRGVHHAGFVPIASAISNTLKEMDRKAQLDAHGNIPSGFDGLDRIISGFAPTDLIIVAARPSMGKTAFSLQVALAAAKAGYGVALVSLEMATPQLILRMLASEGKLETGRLRSGQLTGSDWQVLAYTSGSLEALPIAINDSPDQTIPVIRSQLRQLTRKMPLGMVIVDYLQLIPDSYDAKRRQEEVSAASRALKLMAKELQVCMIALSQLNRECEHRPDKRPLLSDLRESGAIEQDADMVLALYRDEVYNQPSERPGIAEVIVRKNRNGPTGFAELTWANQWTRFADLEG